MRIDTATFNGSNPFTHFKKCTELTIMLDENRFILTGKVGSISIVAFFDSEVTQTAESNHKTAYTVPLSFTASLFAMDNKAVENTLSLQTTDDSVEITYNGVTIKSSIFSPNGLTIAQIKGINWDSQSYSTAPFLDLLSKYGKAQDNVLNVSHDTLFISEMTKSLMVKGEVNYGKQFAIPLAFIRAIKDFEAEVVSLEAVMVARTKGGLMLLDNMLKMSDDSPIHSYAFASKIKTDFKYKVDLRRVSNLINLAVNNKSVSANLNLRDSILTVKSQEGEETIVRLDNRQVSFLHSVDVFNVDMEQPVNITDARLLKTLASFKEVKVKVMPEFIIAKLDNKYKLIFTVYEPD